MLQVELRVRRLLMGIKSSEIRSLMIRSASLTGSSQASELQLELQKQTIEVLLAVSFQVLG